MNDRVHDEYKTATDNATNLHNQIETYDIIYPVLYGISVACIVPTIIYMVKQNKVKKKINFAVIPSDDGFLVSIQYNF